MSDENKETDPGLEKPLFPQTFTEAANPFRETEPPSEHGESPRHNELLPCPFCGDDSPTVRYKREACWWIECENWNCARPTTTIQHTKEAAIASWNKRAPLSDDVKAVEKEGDLGLKEASEHSAHIRQNALNAIRTLRIAVKVVIRRYELGATPEYGFEILQAAIRNTEDAEKLILSEHDGKQGAAQVNQTPAIAAPVTPKSEKWTVIQSRDFKNRCHVIESGSRRIIAPNIWPDIADQLACAHNVSLSVSSPAGSSTKEERSSPVSSIKEDKTAEG